MTIFEYLDKHEALAVIAVVFIGLALIQLAESMGKWGRRE